MPGEARPTNGKLHMYLQARREGDTIKWSLDDQDPPRVGACTPIHAPKDSGSSKIHFHILESPGINARFDTIEPIWIEMGGECPPKKGIDTHGQIEWSSCDSDTLILKNKNKGQPANFTYQLNFIGAPALDPEIRNGGGNIHIAAASTIGITIAAAGLGAAAGYLACAQQSKRR